MAKLKRICVQCKKIFFVHPSDVVQGRGKNCSVKCQHLSRIGFKYSLKSIKKMSLAKLGTFFGESHPRWKGGKHILTTRNGIHYRRVTLGFIKLPTRMKPIYKYEHRVVMERILGRSLKPEEVVHHINGDSLDNRPSNLMLFKNNAEHRRFHTLHTPQSVHRP